MESLNNLLKKLLDSGIDFVLIGGYAAVLHGSSQVTQDIDICAVMSDENLGKLRGALKGLEPRHRMNPNFQPTLDEYPAPGQKINNYYLRTNSGILDIIEDVRPIGAFERIVARAITVSLFGKKCKVIALDDLIEIKETMTRPKDLATLQELKILRSKIGAKS
jgi:predicted nucleotidyltransferase